MQEEAFLQAGESVAEQEEPASVNGMRSPSAAVPSQGEAAALHHDAVQHPVSNPVITSRQAWKCLAHEQCGDCQLNDFQGA